MSLARNGTINAGLVFAYILVYRFPCWLPPPDVPARTPGRTPCPWQILRSGTGSRPAELFAVHWMTAKAQSARMTGLIRRPGMNKCLKRSCGALCTTELEMMATQFRNLPTPVQTGIPEITDLPVPGKVPRPGHSIPESPLIPLEGRSPVPVIRRLFAHSIECIPVVVGDW